MKQGIQIVILLVILAGFTHCKKKEVDIVYDKKYIKEIKEIRKELSFYMSRNFIPGGSFAIMKDGKFIYSEAMGYASKDLEVPASRNTKFRIGKVSELFTSLAYQKMVEDGILHPDSSVQAYIPDFPQKEYRLILADLAEHTSGIRPAYNSEINWPGLNVTLQKGLDQFKNDPLESIPRWYQTQSLYNYNLLGAVMEKASGKPFKDILSFYVTDTLHLANTEVDHPFITIKGRTNYFDHNLVAQVTNATFRDMRFRAPAEGLLSTAEDLAKFGDAVMNSDCISDNIKKRLFEPQELEGDIPASMANGWMMLKSENGDNLYGRTGGVTGGGAAIVIYPKQNLVVVGMVNLSSDTDEIPVFQMLSPFFKALKKTQDNPVENQQAPSGK